MQIVEFKKSKSAPVAKEQRDEMIRKMRKEHEKMVKGKFEFIDAQGGWIDFCYRIFPGDPLMKITLVHNEITELPMGIVKHINNCVKKIRKFDVSELTTLKRGLPGTYEVQSRIRFTPVDFL